jgi:hypothetical protein
MAALQDLTGLRTWLGAETGLGPVSGLEPVSGGTDKQVVRVHLADGGSVISYLWPATRPALPTSRSELLFLPRSTADAFEHAHTLLASLGVRLPRLLLVDRSVRWVEGAVAVVEDVGRRDVASVLHDRAELPPSALTSLARILRRLHSAVRDHCGHLLADPRPDLHDAWDVVRERAASDLDEAAARDPRVRAAVNTLSDTVTSTAAAIVPRREFRLVHGELGPEHVLLDEQGQPVLIDVEGATYLDPEWEHAWLRIRYGAHYEQLRVPGLDPHRLRLATLAQHLSYVVGPLRLLEERDDVDRAALTDIANHHVTALLQHGTTR